MHSYALEQQSLELGNQQAPNKYLPLTALTACTLLHQSCLQTHFFVCRMMIVNTNCTSKSISDCAIALLAVQPDMCRSLTMVAWLLHRSSPDILWLLPCTAMSDLMYTVINKGCYEHQQVCLSNLQSGVAQVSKEEVVQSLRKQSSGAQKTSSQHRGVTKHPKDKWEARMGPMIGHKYE